MDTTKSARDLIRFQGNRLNGTSCSRGLFIFQINVLFPMRIDHLFISCHINQECLATGSFLM
ncbi:hypothetical protein NC651_010970 [Populus alba x Populus x berolinensis]|nr:hypothetical protein NC651_010970 [Populus alba x Populus x berolinensis]